MAAGGSTVLQVLLLVLLAMVSASASSWTTSSVVRVDQSKRSSEREEINLVFYMHDLPGGPKPTGVVVAGNLTTLGLGMTLVFDDPLTDGPGAGSNPVGAGQGLYSVASATSADLLLVFTAVFREPHPFAGSTLAFHGSDPIAQPKREVAVVGGTGRLRFARGFAVIETASLDPPNAILKVNVTLRLD